MYRLESGLTRVLGCIDKAPDQSATIIIRGQSIMPRHAIIMRLLGRMQTGLKKPRLYIHHLFGLMQFTVQYCFHVICMYVPKCNFERHRQISGRFPMSHVDLGLFREGGLRSHVDLGTIGLTGPRSQDDMGQNPRLTQHWMHDDDGVLKIAGDTSMY